MIQQLVNTKNMNPKNHGSELKVILHNVNTLTHYCVYGLNCYDSELTAESHKKYMFLNSPPRWCQDMTQIQYFTIHKKNTYISDYG